MLQNYMQSGEIYSWTKDSRSYVGVYCVEEGVGRLRLGVPYTHDNRSNDGGTSVENLYVVLIKMQHKQFTKGRINIE